MRVYSPKYRAASRAGFSLLEMFVAGILLTAILAAIGPTVYWVQRAQRTTEQQQSAMLELSSQMELVFAQKDAVTSESLGKLTLSAFALTKSTIRPRSSAICLVAKPKRHSLYEA